MLIFGSGCSGGPGDPLDSDGPPRILQVLARERVAIVDDEGLEHVELQARLAFGDHPDIDVVADDRVVGDAVARDGQRLRVVVDELLRGSSLEEIPCADGSWSRVPAGTDIDDIARCAGADLRRCEAVCIGADGPVGILDANGDGAIDDTRLIDGAVVLTCDGVAVALDRSRSYYQPAGSQRLATGSVGTDSLGPAIAIVPAEGMRPGATCTLGFTDVVDKQGLALCAAADGGDCAPGDTSAIAFGVEAFTLATSEPHDGATDVPLTVDGSQDAAITIQLNSELAPASVRGAIRVKAGDLDLDDLEATMAEDDAATIHITVPGGFRAGTTYAVTVVGGAGGIKNRFDDALASDRVVTWTTAAKEDGR
ncbi:MAG: Ig-like domain-containing protein [Deltaproteobacteria bacterium]|nr:Ig-like domain-containing protein [Kofleriaceae bacterium]